MGVFHVFKIAQNVPKRAKHHIHSKYDKPQKSLIKISGNILVLIFCWLLHLLVKFDAATFEINTTNNSQ